MEEWVQIEKRIKAASGVDAFAKRVIAVLIDAPAGEFSGAVEFSPDPMDPCSFFVRAHRRRLHFEFGHVVIEQPFIGNVLAGRFAILDVDKNGDRTGRDGTVILYPDVDVVFNSGTHFKLPDSASEANMIGVRDAFARLAATIAQRDLETFKQ